MSLDFSNAYQEVLIENIDAILKQNFLFQAKIKLFEREANTKSELQAKVEELSNLYQESLQQINKSEQYKIQAENSSTIVQEKTRIQSALNDAMKSIAILNENLEAKEDELKKTNLEVTELKMYIAKLEELVPANKLKKINIVKEEEQKPVDVTPIDLFTLKVDGSTF